VSVVWVNENELLPAAMDDEVVREMAGVLADEAVRVIPIVLPVGVMNVALKRSLSEHAGILKTIAVADVYRTSDCVKTLFLEKISIQCGLGQVSGRPVPVIVNFPPWVEREAGVFALIWAYMIS
jgi:hypothetical protein